MKNANKGYWDVNRDTEEWVHETIDEAIFDYVKHLSGTIPQYLDVYRSTVVELDPSTQAMLQEFVLDVAKEYLDEDYGHPEYPTEQTNEMIKIADEFAKKLLDIYPIGRCERDEQYCVRMTDWCKENAPELLTRIEEV